MKYLIILCFWMVGTAAPGQSEAIRVKQYNVEKKLALEGYDPVSYFSGNPLEGKSTIAYTYKGVTYWFASTSNLNKFKTTPDKYEPAYGGWCAYAMGESGERVKIDPETYKVVNGKLYLFYNFWGNNTQKDWDKDEQNLKSQADKNWQKFIH